MQLIRVALLCVAMAGCTVHSLTTELPSYLSISSREWSADGLKHDAVQQLHVTVQGQEMAFQTRLKVADSGLKLAAVGPLGQRALNVDWNDRGVQAVPAPWLPNSVVAEDILADLMLILWPKEQLSTYLASEDLVIVEDAYSRQLIYRGREVVKIRYEAGIANAWSGKSTLTDVRRNLTVVVESNEVADG